MTTVEEPALGMKINAAPVARCGGAASRRLSGAILTSGQMLQPIIRTARRSIS